MRNRNLVKALRSIILLCSIAGLPAGAGYPGAVHAATPGSLDLTFGRGGVMAIEDIYSSASATAVQDDGRIVVAGTKSDGISGGVFLVTRLYPDGSVDDTFGNSGRVIISLGSCNSAVAVNIQEDGKIVVAGNVWSTCVEVPKEGPPSFAVLRFNPNGTPDQTFGTNGKVVHFVGGAAAADMALQPDGKIVVAGSRAVRRYLPDGNLDPTFRDPDLNQIIEINSVRLQDDGKIVLAGRRLSDFCLVRLKPEGDLDRSFDGDGITTTDLGGIDFVTSVALQKDQKIVVGGIAEYSVSPQFYRFGLARYDADGSLDETFGDGGILNGGSYNYCNSIAVQPDGKIVSAGSNSQYLWLNRRHLNGSPDSTFGMDGNILIALPKERYLSSPVALSISLQPTGGVIAAGYAQDYGGGPHLTVVRIRTEPSRTPFDFDADGRTDVGIFRPDWGEWWISRSSAGAINVEFGGIHDVMAPADYTGDAKTDVAVWRPSTGEWFVLRSEDFTHYLFPFGTDGDIPSPGDFDGDTRADATVFRPSTGYWYILRSSDGVVTQTRWGLPSDVPVTGDYDGDGLDDIAVFRPATSEWWLLQSSAGVIAMRFGLGTDRIVPGDYTGDGKTDCAVWRPSTGEWLILRREDLSYYSFPFGLFTDLPAPGDYDGDGKLDATVFRPSSGTWYQQQSANGINIFQWGLSIDQPVAGAYIR